MILCFCIIAGLSLTVWLFLFVALAYPLNKRLDPLFKNARYFPADDIEGYWFEPSIVFLMPKYLYRSGKYIMSAVFRKYRVLDYEPMSVRSHCEPMNVRSHLPIWLAHACDIAVTALLICGVCMAIVLVISFIDFFRVHWFKLAPLWQ